MTAPRDTALLDQIRAAEAEVRNADLASWLQPEGVQASVEVAHDAEHIGPVTRRFMGWLANAPHLPGCEVAAGPPVPLFAVVKDSHVFCADCFGWVLDGFLASEADHCSICLLDADELRPVTMTLGLFVVYALVCEECTLNERKAALTERYSRIAGQLPRHLRDQHRGTHR